MNDKSLAFERIKQQVRVLLPPGAIEQHAFFQALADDSLRVNEAHAIALDIYHVVRHFPRFLSALITSLESIDLRMTLVDNLYEEHGRMNRAVAHEETFKLFLRGLGIEDAQILANRPSVPVVAYCRAVTDLCLHHPPAEAVGAIGMIEEIVARVSPLISAYGQRKQMQARDVRSHFGVHEVLDIRHADEIYGLGAILVERDASRGALVERGLEMGLYLHRRLYSDLLERHIAINT